MWWAELGSEDARSLMAAMNEPAETALRVNTLKADPDALVKRLRATGEPIAGGDPGPLWPPEAIVVDGPLSQAVRTRIAAGELVPQSRGSQAAVAALDPRPDQRILDLCAAPGIKTTAIAARVRDRGEVVAVDQDPGRASQLEELCERLGVRSVRVVVGDAAEIDLGDGYDRVSAGRALAQVARVDRAGRRAPGQDSWPRRRDAEAGRQARLLGLHDFPP